MPPKQKDQLARGNRNVAGLDRRGADWPDGVTLQAVARINFARDVQPILEDGGAAA